MSDTFVFEFDGSQAEKEAKKVAASLLKINEEQIAYIKYAAKFNDASKNTIDSFKKIVVGFEDGSRAFLTSINKMENAKVVYDTTKKKIDESSLSIAKNAREHAKLAAEVSEAGIKIKKGLSLDVLSSNNRLKINAMIVDIQKYAYAHKISAAEITRVWEKVKIGDIIPEYGSLGTLQNKLVGLKTSMVDLAKTGKGLTINWETMFRLAQLQLVHRAVSLILIQLKQSLGEAIDFQIKIGEIQTIDSAKMPFDAWSSGLTQLSNSWGLDVLDQAAGAYEAISNQLVKGAETLNFLNEANKFAVTTNSSVDDSISLLSGTLNAYGKTAANVTDVSAKLFKIIDLGAIRANEMAQTIGRVAVPAEQLGIDLNELGAMITVMTRKGVKGNEAFTMMNNILMKLIKPTDAMKEFFREMGVSSGVELINVYTYPKAMQLLEKYTKGAVNELAELFNTQRGLRGAMFMSDESLVEYNKDLEKLTNSTGDYEKAVETMVNNTGLRVKIFNTGIRNAFLDIGNNIIKSTGEFLLWYDSLNNSNIEYVKILGETKKEFGSLNSTIRDETKKNIESINKSVTETKKQMNQIEDTYIDTFDTIYKGIKSNLDKVQDEIFTANDKLRDSIKSSMEQINQLKQSKSAKLFDIKISGLSDTKKIKEIEKRLQSMYLLSKQYSLFGDKKQFEGVESEIKRLLELKKSITKEDSTSKSLAKEINDEMLRRSNFAKSNLLMLQRQTKLENEYNDALKTVKEYLPSKVDKADSTEKVRIYKEQISSLQKMVDLQKKYGVYSLNTYDLEKKISEFESSLVIEKNRIKLGTIEEENKTLNETLKSTQNTLNKLKEERNSLLTVSKASLKPLEEMVDKAATGSFVKNQLTPGMNLEPLSQYYDKLKNLQELLIKFNKQPITFTDINSLKEAVKFIQTTSISSVVSEDRKRMLNDLYTTVNQFEDDSLAKLNNRISQQEKFFESIQSIVNGTKSVAESTIEAIGSQNEKLKEQIQLQDKIYENAVRNFNQQYQQSLLGYINTTIAGALTGKAKGGYIRSSDTVPALLTPGEFVVNKDSAKKYYSQLVGINKGYANGGTVTNSFGGINVNLNSSGNTQIDAISIAKAIKREIRRGTVTLQ